MSTEAYDDYKGSVSVPSSLERIIGYTVHDAADDHVGKVQNLWIDDTGHPIFAGVKTGWLFGKNHVVPLETAEINDHRKIVRVPFTSELLKKAPSIDEAAEISDAEQDSIRSYYSLTSASGPACELPPRQSTAVAQEQMELPRPSTTTDERNIQLKEEEVKLGKREVEAGGVRLRKVIRTETINQPVELKREELVIERVPANTPAGAGESFQNEDVYIPLKREEPVVEKTARVTEEVRVGKKVETERRQMSEQVRKEDIEVDRRTTGQP
jgi:uncharacterized protein (TIGR02271 family)